MSLGVVGWVLLGVAGIGLAVALEGWRQSRKLGRASGRPNLLGVGALELQRHLEPERKVEIVLEDARGDERHEPGYRAGRPADDPGTSPLPPHRGAAQR